MDEQTRRKGRTEADVEADGQPPPLAALFLGPRAENADIWSELLGHTFQDYVHWRRNYFPRDPIVVGRARRRSESHEAWLDQMIGALDGILNELKHHFPFHSPRYIGHMLSEQTLPSVLGLFAGTLYNPNNVTDEAAPITVSLEIEVGKMVATMLGYNPKRCWAHLTSGGTIANIEALWVARLVQFVPLTVKEFCQSRGIPFTIKRADGLDVKIEDLSTSELIGLRPNEAFFMLRKLAAFIHNTYRQPYPEILADINLAVSSSKYSVAKRGLAAVTREIGLTPAIFVSAAAHFSIAKAANALGYGEDAIHFIDVTSRFHMNLERLREALFHLPQSSYVAAVVGIVGTTEEGAVDRIHQIRFLRDELEREKKRSFWLHIDAAWGGYIRSLFVDAGVPEMRPGTGLEVLCAEYVKALKVQEEFHIDVGVDHREERLISIRWAEKETYAAFLAMSDADSITVDPHKLGYAPYPAGIIAFKNGLVTELIQQRAPYISDVVVGIKNVDELPPITAVGPYILEGSKPGSVALGCWLAHKTIPLTTHGHGKIIRTSLLNSKKLFKYLVNHRHMFRRMHFDNFKTCECTFPFTFVPLFEPDTNVVCFVAKPMRWHSGQLTDTDILLADLNELNRHIYRLCSIPPSEDRIRIPTAQPFYLSRTTFDDAHYKGSAIDGVLKLVGVHPEEYTRHGLYVLRSTVMNPWYYEAERAGMSYLREFVCVLHKVTADVVQKFYTQSGAERS